MGPKTQQLATVLKELISLLERHGETHWSTSLDRNLVQICRGDFGGIEAFLSVLGGMGSFNDFILHPMNGHAIDEADVDAANKKLRQMTSECTRLALEVKRVAVLE